VHEALYQPFPMAGAARGQIWQYAPRYRRPRHFHPEPELNLITAGSASFGVGVATLPVAAGDLVWWLPGQDHELLEASPDFDLYVIGLAPALSERVLGTGRAPAYSGPTKVRLAPHALARLRARCATPIDGHEPSAVETRVGDFWREAHALRAGASGMHALTRRALASMLERPDLGRAQVARRARGYPSEVSRHFHENVGLTLTAFRTRLRLLRFIGMADGGASNLLSSALAAGFGSYSQCHRTFQKTFGCAPRDFFLAGVKTTMRDAFSPFAHLDLDLDRP
jgi:AraC-like DNA-binding protein